MKAKQARATKSALIKVKKAESNRTSVGLTLSLKGRDLEHAMQRAHVVGSFSRVFQLLIEFDRANPDRLAGWVKTAYPGGVSAELTGHGRSGIRPVSVLRELREYVLGRTKESGITITRYLQLLLEMDMDKNIILELLTTKNSAPNAK